MPQDPKDEKRDHISDNDPYSIWDSGTTSYQPRPLSPKSSARGARRGPSLNRSCEPRRPQPWVLWAEQAPGGPGLSIESHITL